MNGHQARLVLPAGARDHVRGSADAPATLLEYGDFECPYCGAAHPVIENVRRQLGKSLRFVYRHFPLTNVHPNAESAAEASEAAAVQDAFWPMHDTLFEHQDALGRRDLLVYAEALGLDPARVQRDLATAIHAPRVREDFISGARSGVNGTPTFFINGSRYDGPRDADSLVAALEGAMAVGSRGIF